MISTSASATLSELGETDEGAFIAMSDPGPNIFPYRRTIVFGGEGAGKTTLAQRISDEFGVPFVEMDDLFDRARKSDRPTETLSTFAEEVTNRDNWILAGSYPEVQSMTWTRAEAIVWLDYPVWLMAWRLIVRRLGRIFSRHRVKRVVHSVGQLQKGRVAGFVRVIVGHSLRRKIHFCDLYHARNRHLHIIRLRCDREARQWLAGVSGIAARQQ